VSLAMSSLMTESVIDHAGPVSDHPNPVIDHKVLTEAIKRTLIGNAATSAFDPKRTSLEISALCARPGNARQATSGYFIR
jgi:hypothetical protein